MSGHSHWATIKHKKAAIDAKRGKLWSKLSRAILIAARHGGSDLDTNLKLRYAIDKAREVSMPKDNIDRAIKRGTGEAQGEIIEELQYEGFGSGGTAILVDVMTDNRNRSAGEIRKIFERNAGKMGSAGNVSFLFERKGLFLVPVAAIDEDSLMALVLEAGADDLKAAGDHFEIICDPAAFHAVQLALEGKKLTVSSAELMQLPKVPVDVDTEAGRKVLRLMEALDDHDDVQHVYSNVHVTEEMMAEA